MQYLNFTTGCSTGF